jgi:hypothetical protein
MAAAVANRAKQKGIDNSEGIVNPGAKMIPAYFNKDT